MLGRWSEGAFRDDETIRDPIGLYLQLFSNRYQLAIVVGPVILNADLGCPGHWTVWESIGRPAVGTDGGLTRSLYRMD